MEASAKHFESPGSEAVNSDAGADATFTCFQESIGECMSSNEIRDDGNAISTERLEMGQMQYGYATPKNACSFIAQLHCSKNEYLNFILTDVYIIDDDAALELHAVMRFLTAGIATMRLCTEQDIKYEVRQVCINCGVCMGKYFCGTCKLFDDDLQKGAEALCLVLGLKVQKSVHHVLFKNVAHMERHKCRFPHRLFIRYACPLCSKSVCDMSKVWEKIDTEIAATPMPDSYQNKMANNREANHHWSIRLALVFGGLTFSSVRMLTKCNVGLNSKKRQLLAVLHCRS
ncbi:hypothetical protein ACLOJK_037923 [Asimina triloba]